MSLSLNNLQAPKGDAARTRTRKGRGNASGLGTYSGRGLKGQKSRSGVSGLKLKGLRRRLLSIPKLRGFTSLNKKNATVNLSDLELAFEAGAMVSPKTLMKKGLITTPRFGAKILGSGELKKALKFKNVTVSASAKAAIEKAGGSLEK
jgi:large subunit ribosomal protein L15